MFGCFHRSIAWELKSLSTWEFYHDLTNRRFRGAVDFTIKQVGKYLSKCFYLLDVFICLWKYSSRSKTNVNDESRGRKEINLCLAALLCDQLLPIREWRCPEEGVKISIKFFSTDIVFFPVHPAVLKYQAKIDLPVFWVNCRLYGLLISEECGKR